MQRDKIEQRGRAEQDRVNLIRRLRFMEATEWPRNANIVELFCGRGGGVRALHSLEDLDQVLAEAKRVLRDNGLLLVVEPWLTPFLSLVHTLCRSRLIRALSPKIDACATMIHYELKTYQQWLNQPLLVLDSLHKAFRVERSHFRWVKFISAGAKAQCGRRYGLFAHKGHAGQRLAQRCRLFRRTLRHRGMFDFLVS